MTITEKADKADKAAIDANIFLKISEIMINTVRKNKSKLKNLTEAQLRVILERASAAEDQPLAEIEFMPEELNYDIDLNSILSTTFAARTTPAPVTTMTPGSKRITIRIPGDVLAQYKEKAKAMCIPYQRLINRKLRAALAGL